MKQITRSTFSILFYINRQKVKKNGKCPIMGRITIDGKLTQFSVKEDIKECNWSAKKARSKGNEKSDKQLNRKLDKHEQTLKFLYNKLVETEAYVTAESLKKAFLSHSDTEPMLLAEFRKHNAEYLKTVGVTKTKGTYNTYIHAYKSLEKFINKKLGVEDIALRELQYSFMEDFEFFMRAHLEFGNNTIFNILLKLKRIVYVAINQGLINRNPFVDFRCSQESTKRKWLSKTDLDKILHTPMKETETEFVRLMFLFSTFTGLAYVDLQALSYKNILEEQGLKFIHIKRKKTNTQALVPIMGIALEIYEKYRNHSIDGLDVNKETDKVFAIPSYQLVKYHLDKIMNTLDLEHLSYHESRHTFSTTICLSNGIPIETLSRMLGHKNISTTQIYAKITHQKVEEDMQALEKRIAGKYQFSNQTSSQKFAQL